MSPSKADRLITRITALHHSLEMDKDEGPSPLERDLMLGYLRELYDIYLNQGDKLIEAGRTSAAPPARSAPPEVIAPASAPPPDPPQVREGPTPPPVGQAVSPQAASQPDPEIEALFEQEDGTGSPLMRQKVNDLTRALSINNRVLFANKLFGNDNEALNVALRDLNLKGSIEYARPTLANLASRHHWAESQRQETAREFIDLVRRRYA